MERKMQNDLRLIEPQLEKTYRLTHRLIGSSSAGRNFASLAIQIASCKKSDQIASLCRLIWIVAGRIWQKVRCLALRLHYREGNFLHAAAAINGQFFIIWWNYLKTIPVHSSFSNYTSTKYTYFTFMSLLIIDCVGLSLFRQFSKYI